MTFASTKAAIAAAALLSKRLDYPRATSSPVVQSAPNRERERLPHLVRAALRRADVDPDGDDAQLLYTWSVTTDRRDVFDDAIEATETDGDYLEVLELGDAARARLFELLELVGRALVELGVVERPARPTLTAVGWRVHEYPDGRREVLVVTEPAEDDPTVYRGHRGLEAATSVARRLLEGPVCRCSWAASTRPTVTARACRRPDLAAVFVPRWEAGEFPALGDLDRAIASEMGRGLSHARKIRASWGISGTRGLVPTRPPERAQ